MSQLSAARIIMVAYTLATIGTLGFHFIDGMIAEDAGGNPWINAFYCSVITLTTVGYGDICPSDKMSHAGRIFIIALSFCGLGMFCGPIMDLSSSWKERIPGGIIGPGTFALASGIVLFTYFEGMSIIDAAYFTIITGTTVGYGDLGPKTDFGRLATALFAILVVNVIGGMLEPAKKYLSDLCVVSIERTESKLASDTKKTRKKKKN
mmetsp:Transcript_27431/g.54889  ORF Transcript_27431/g.54889 Transcript_27431/m.54889 type:complete len:207 (+) Transcript_27431:223-843(+)